MNASLGVRIPAGPVQLEGELDVPDRPTGVVAFAHGSGSGRHSPRNRLVARVLHDAGLATLLLDLLTAAEDAVLENRFDIGLLSGRLEHAVTFLREHPVAATLPLGLFGASTGAASALRVAAHDPGTIRAVVSRGGRPDLAGADALAQVRAPTLLIVGGRDAGVIELNESARDRMTRCHCELSIVPGATHLFEEPGKLDAVAKVATDWFVRWLRA